MKQPINISRKKSVAIIVNPFSGAGGRLGWKGTDWPLPLRIVKDNISLVAPRRAREFMKYFSNLSGDISVFSPPGLMGWDSLGYYPGKRLIMKCVPPEKWPTTPEDTIKCAVEAVNIGVDLLVFVGGDGTARLIVESVEDKIPVLGVPSGVKVYSAVFAYTPRDAALIAALFLEGKVSVEPRIVLDVDEESFRSGRLMVKPYGYLKVPVIQDLITSSKSVSHGLREEDEILEIAEYFSDELYKDCIYYVMGPGRTVATIASKLGINDKTLLGVDVVHNRKIIAKDVDEEELYNIVKEHIGRTIIVVSPIGGQGFIFGRGNQQISPRIIKLVGKENILIVASPSKLSKLNLLRVDTGDEEVDSMLRGYFRVLIGYGRYRMMKVE